MMTGFAGLTGWISRLVNPENRVILSSIPSSGQAHAAYVRISDRKRVYGIKMQPDECRRVLSTWEARESTRGGIMRELWDPVRGILRLIESKQRIRMSKH